MIRNFFISTFRFLKKNKLFTAINLLGLSLALAISFIIILYVVNEMSYNNCHENKDEVYNIVNYYTDSKDQFEGTAFPLAETLKKEFPEVVAATNTKSNWQIFAKVKEEHIRLKAVCTSDDIFKIFTLPLVFGSIDNGLLENPDDIVLSESLAKKIYGNENPLGKEFVTRMYNTEKVFMVTGVYKDIPENSSLQAECFVNDRWCVNEIDYRFRSNDARTNWYREFWCTWVKLNSNEAESNVESRMRDFEKKYLGPGLNRNFQLHNLNDVYLHSDDILNTHLMGNVGNVTNVRIFTFMAIMVILVAIFNYIILSTAISSLRAKEIGIRKTNGASTQTLRNQFFGESLLLAFLTLPLALLLAWFCLPVAGKLFNTDLHIMSFNSSIYIISYLFIILLVGGVSGLYSAGYLSQIKVIEILKSKHSPKIGGVSFSSVLVVLQLIIFSSFVTGAIIVRYQYAFSMNKDMGYQTKNILLVNISDKSKYEAIINKLKTNPNIINAGGTMDPLPTQGSMYSMQPCFDNPDQQIKVEGFAVDYNFIETMGINVIQGRSFSTEFGGDDNALILNETAVKKLGIKDPIGKKIGRGTIIGVVEDFNIHSLHAEIPPLSISLTKRKRYRKQIAIAYTPGKRQAVIDDLEAYWAELMPGKKPNYFDNEEIYDQIYESEKNLSTIVSISALLTAIISALGLLGLTLFEARNRTKEIGVKRTLGSSSKEIILEIGKKNTILVVAASLFSTPITYFIVDKWLESYAYKTPIHAWFFLLSGTITLLITFITISWQSWKAATRNPVEALRYE